MSVYVPNTEASKQAMLGALGVDSADALFAGVPDALKLKRPLNLPPGKPEMGALAEIAAIAAKNTVFKTIFRGAGAYRHYIPSIVRRIAAKEEFVTAYTPYQPEVSQGVLQCIFEFQTMICELTGMDAANASVYDGAVAAAEAAAMCRAGARRAVVASAAVNPHVLETVRTYCESAGTRFTLAPVKDGLTDGGALADMICAETACVIIQQPNYYGLLERVDSIAGAVHSRGAKLVVSANPTSLAVIAPPGDCGADVAVGEGQPLGLPLAFGGPYLGFMACKRDMARRLPGRIIGETKDNRGERAFVLTLQAREQHIRREKASSNICSNQAHCALTASVYMSAMGPRGMREVAEQCMANAAYLKQKLSAVRGFKPVFEGPFFHEFVTECPVPVTCLERALGERGILAGLPLGGDQSGRVLWCATEMNTQAEMDELAEILGGHAI